MNQSLFFLLVIMSIFCLIACQAAPILAAPKVHFIEQKFSDVKLAKDNKNIRGWQAMIKDAAGKHNIHTAAPIKGQRKMDIGKKWQLRDMESRVLMVDQLDYAAAKTHPPTEP
eukprot:c17925_g1_i2 orf=466-804(-)